MDVQEYLRELAQADRNGFGFLLAYGFTWTIRPLCGGGSANGWAHMPHSFRGWWSFHSDSS